MAGIFVQALRPCRKVTLVSLSQLDLEVTNFSKHMAISHERKLKPEKQVEAEMRALQRQAELIDVNESRQVGNNKCGYVAKRMKLRSSWLDWIRKSKLNWKLRVQPPGSSSGSRKPPPA